ncbi:hypothetical protein GCM10009754_31590 [Amycolatopsis minnesotensis]|uniref:Uncharacterized protein n=1 Tax=Amycolatopsis minnesotensis TaxID=337894 RepID=A0ABP5C6Q9_9PSEU
MQQQHDEREVIKLRWFRRSWLPVSPSLTPASVREQSLLCYSDRHTDSPSSHPDIRLRYPGIWDGLLGSQSLTRGQWADIDLVPGYLDTTVSRRPRPDQGCHTETH